MELWTDVQGYGGDYQVSNQGRVRSYKNKKMRLLKPQPDAHGYVHVRLSLNSKFTLFKVHRLVAMHFIPTHDPTLLVNHIDSVRTNNHVLNLEWVTGAGNMHHLHHEKFTLFDLMHGKVRNPLDFV